MNVHTPALGRPLSALRADCLKQAPMQRRLKPQPKKPPEAASQAAQDSMADSLMGWVGTGVDGISGIGTLITLPGDVIKVADTLGDAAKVIASRGHILTSLEKTPLASIGAKAATGTVKLLEKSTHLSNAARSVMNAPIIGRMTQPHVAKFTSEKILPTVNALASGVSVYEHSKKFTKARSEGNMAGQVVSSIQIGLNTVCGVTGYMKGRGQTVSAMAGLGSLAIDIGSWATGIGYVKLK